MESKKLGEVKGPFIVSFFFALYFAIGILRGGSSEGTLPQDVTMSLIYILVVSIIIGWGPLLVFPVAFLAVWEKRRSLRNIFSGVGLKREGSVMSVFWSVVVLFPFLFIIGLLTVIFSYFLGPIPIPVQSSVSSGGQTPLWIPYYMIIYSFFPVAVVEEAYARGYILDRLMPQHPSSLVKSLPAIVLGSLLSTLYHLPSYLWLYTFSTPWLIALLAGNVFPWSIALSAGYVRARARNILGPILVHFLADAIPYVLMLV